MKKFGATTGPHKPYVSQTSSVYSSFLLPELSNLNFFIEEHITALCHAEWWIIQLKEFKASLNPTAQYDMNHYLSSRIDKGSALWRSTPMRIERGGTDFGRRQM
jgi:hypothetical protein